MSVPCEYQMKPWSFNGDDTAFGGYAVLLTCLSVYYGTLLAVEAAVRRGVGEYNTLRVHPPPWQRPHSHTAAADRPPPGAAAFCHGPLPETLHQGHGVTLRVLAGPLSCGTARPGPHAPPGRVRMLRQGCDSPCSCRALVLRLPPGRVHMLHDLGFEYLPDLEGGFVPRLNDVIVTASIAYTVASRSIPPPWRSIRFRLALRTYAPWGVRVVSQTKSRKIPTPEIYHRSLP